MNPELLCRFARQVLSRRRLSSRLLVAGVLLVFLVLSLASVAIAIGVFPDVDVYHRYHGAIRELSSLGVIKGYENGNFGPGDEVTRQQFAKMIVKAGEYEVPSGITCPFGDVAAQLGNDPLYPAKYVAVCAAHGITVGKTSTTFDPYGNITRYQVITMVVRATQDLKPDLLSEPPDSWESESGWDADSIHGHNAALAEYGQLLTNIDLTVNPYNNATRGEVAQILHNLIAQLKYASNPLRCVFYLGLNVQQPPLDDPLVRRALSLAVDREAIVAASGNPTAAAATGWLAKGIPGFDEINQGLLATTAQLAEAAALLADAGYPGGASLPEIKIHVLPANQALGDLVKSQWEAIGVKATVVVVPWGEYWPLLGSGEGLYVYRAGWWADFNDPYEFYDLFRSGRDMNYTRWENEDYDELLNQALMATTVADALAAYQALEAMLVRDEAPVIPLYWMSP